MLFASSCIAPLRQRAAVLVGAVCLLCALAAYGQTPPDSRELAPEQTQEREITGAEKHLYRVTLAANEFFQSRAEQKGADVRLRLLDAAGRELARMGTPTGTKGAEVLTWVADASGVYILEVSNFDPQSAKGAYSIVRAAKRATMPTDRRRVTTEKAFVLGVEALSTEGQTAIAIAQLTEALRGWEELKDDYLTKLTASKLKWLKTPPEVKTFINEFNAAVDTYTQSESVISKQGTIEAVLESRTKILANIETLRKLLDRLNEGEFSRTFEQHDFVTADYMLFVKIYERLSFEALANLSTYLKEPADSVKYQKLAVAWWQEVRANPKLKTSQHFDQLITYGRLNELSILSGITGNLITELNMPGEALTFANQALALSHDIQRDDKNSTRAARYVEVLTLRQLGNIYEQLGNRQRALDCLLRALAVVSEWPEAKTDETELLQVISLQYLNRVDYENGLKYLEAALKNTIETNSLTEQPLLLQGIGTIQQSLGNEEKARTFFSRSLAILLSPEYITALQHKNSENATATNKALGTNYASPAALELYTKAINEFFRYLQIGDTYLRLKETNKAREYYEKALLSARETKSTSHLRLILNSFGQMYEDQENWSQALDYYSQALAINRQIGEKSQIARDLYSLGFVYFKQGNLAEALKHSDESLSVLLSLGAGEKNLYRSYSGVLSLLGQIHNALGNKRLAIFYGKQTVNAIQLERRRLRNLAPEQQRGYLQQNEKAYRRLAQWLIDAGRIGEAEQVLALLKEEELFEYLRRDDKVARELLNSSVNLDDAERAAIARYDRLAEQITAIGKEYDELLEESSKPIYRDNQQPFPHEARLTELRASLDAANATFAEFQKELERIFGKDSRRVDFAAKSGLQSILQHLRARRTVFVSTIVGEKRLSLIVTTTQTRRAHTIEIDETQLNRLVNTFRCALTDPKLDPRPSGQKLYDVLVKPIEKDLAGANAETIVWSLDGALRYLPPAALWDAERGYLVQRYASAVVTLASIHSLESPISDKRQWRALGVGVSKGGEGFRELPAVPGELACIVTDLANPDAVAACPRGILDGRRLLDENFTQAAFSRALERGGYQVIHIASHFSFQPGNEKTSFLLLGGGEPRKYSVADLQNDSLTGAELVTFSACNTATPGGARASDGVEVESFSAVAQQKGAKAVAATLWAVADPSTRDLMVKFYQLYGQGALTKAEALRQAQLALLQAPDLAQPNPKPVTRAEIVGITAGAECATQPKFVTDSVKSYAHPYYWSPFILFGNWR